MLLAQYFSPVYLNYRRGILHKKYYNTSAQQSSIIKFVNGVEIANYERSVFFNYNIWSKENYGKVYILISQKQIRFLGLEMIEIRSDVNFDSIFQYLVYL